MGSYLEEGLLVKEKLLEENNIEVVLTDQEVKWDVIWMEIKKIGYLAGPMASVTLSQYLLQVISMMMVGHLGQLYLSSTAIAVSLATVTGLTLLVCISISSFLFCVVQTL
ncbi:hypothetical protein KY285_019258 [Solanum tuberosum]|nr:hypothetical protein KY285_019258 [Solanum tuberosum]